MYPQQVPTVIIPAQADPIHTKRLLLRPLQTTDASGIFAIRSLQEVANTLWPKTPDPDVATTERWMSEKTFRTPDASGVLGRAFYFVMIRADDPSERIIGTVGINSLDPSPSVGHTVYPEVWGQGYATEALGGVMDAWWKLPRGSAKEELEKTSRDSEEDEPVEKLYAACNKANVGSVKVLLKNGFKIYTEVPMEGDIVAFMEVERPSPFLPDDGIA